MKLAIMQPYFIPYLGYWQLINAVDHFIIYDNIEYTKKGWINRNYVLISNNKKLITLPIKKSSDFSFIQDRSISNTFNRFKILKQIKTSYKKAPYFHLCWPTIEKIFSYEEDNLFLFIYHSIIKICQYLEIHTKIKPSSEILIDHSLKGENKVISLCKQLNASIYINPYSGTQLYSNINFQANGIELHFIKPDDIQYKQFEADFIPSLSILDIIMFNEKKYIKDKLLNAYQII